jgi:hypothetical protein
MRRRRGFRQRQVLAPSLPEVQLKAFAELSFESLVWENRLTSKSAIVGAGRGCDF